MLAGPQGLEPQTSVPKTGVIPFHHGPMILWCRFTDSNRGPTDYKSVALPAELKRRNSFRRRAQLLPPAHYVETIAVPSSAILNGV